MIDNRRYDEGRILYAAKIPVVFPLRFQHCKCIFSCLPSHARTLAQYRVFKQCSIKIDFRRLAANCAIVLISESLS